MIDIKTAILQARDASRGANDCLRTACHLENAIKAGNNFEAGMLLAKLQRTIGLLLDSITSLERDLGRE